MFSILIPTGLTFEKIKEGTPASSLNALNKYLIEIELDPVFPGDTNPLIFHLLGVIFERGSNMSELAICNTIGNIDFDFIKLIVDIGGDVTGVPMWFELEDPDSLVPLDLPLSSINGVRQKWRDWCASHNKLIEYNGRHYKSTKLESGMLRASQWIKYINPIGGVQIVHELKEIE